MCICMYTHNTFHVPQNLLSIAKWERKVLVLVLAMQDMQNSYSHHHHRNSNSYFLYYVTVLFSSLL